MFGIRKSSVLSKAIIGIIVLFVIGICIVLFWIANSPPTYYPTYYMNGGGAVGYGCFQIKGIEAQPRPTYSVLVNLENGKECRFEKGHKGMFNVHEITNMGPTGCIGECNVVDLNWAYEVGSIEPDCDEKINSGYAQVVGTDNRVFGCMSEMGV